MKIANPIYDVVFKYLMADNKVAKLIISKIIDQEVESLEFKPTEYQKKQGGNFIIMRIDFAATIKNADGSKKLVLIEIQKAKFPTDIMRFRKYLGKQYANKNNSYIDKKTGKTMALPIISLYFLGHKLDHTTCPVVKVARKYFDVATNKELTVKEEFIESLSHDSYIIQIPFLKKKRSTDLEILLSIFDQSQISKGYDEHFLTINEDNFPDEFKMIIRRLLKAGAEEDVCDEMDTEDDVLDELENYERRILDLAKKNEDNAKALEDKDKALEDHAKALEDKDKSLANALEALMKTGLSSDEAKRILNM